MEADWEFEIGGDSPVIEGDWRGYVDLRSSPERVWELSECRELPALARALVSLNGAGSPVWTSKCDLFTPAGIDPDEFAASEDEADHAVSCYVDVLLHRGQTSDLHSKVKRDCRQICSVLRRVELARCRVDLVVRRAVAVAGDELGITVYLTGCGPTVADARERLGECIKAFSEVIILGEWLRSS